jgi:hypothetical protein
MTHSTRCGKSKTWGLGAALGVYRPSANATGTRQPTRRGLLAVSAPSTTCCGMQFRIVGAHQHKAVVGPSTFLCVRRDTPTETGLTVRWLACRNEAVLKDDCRTLNEAKNLCRQVSAEELLLG